MFKAFSRLSKKDKTVLIIVGLWLLIAAAYGLVSFLRNGFPQKVVFPQSTLAPSAENQTYQLKNYDELPTLIKFPELPIGVSVGGKEAVITERGCTFEYGSGRYLCALETVKDGDINQILTQQLGSCLFGEGEVRYKQEIADSGYINTLYTDYNAGTLSSNGTRYYVLSYLYHTTEDKDVFLAVADTYSNSLIENKETLDRMYYTLCLMKDESVSVEDTKEDKNVSENAISAEEKETEKTTTAGERMKEIVAELDAKMQEGKYAKWCEQETTLEENLTDVYFQFHMSCVGLPSEAYLVAPDGTVYQEYWESEYEPGIIFPVQNAMKGNWRAVVAVDGRELGTVFLDASTREIYDAMHDYDRIAEESIPHPVD